MFNRILAGTMAGTGDFQIANAVMLDGVADYFSRTFTTSSTTSGSLWIKRCKLASTTPLFDNKVYFNSSDQLVAFGLTSTAVFRDPTAWMHIFWNGSGVWVNGAGVSGTGSYSQSATTNPRIGYDGTNFASIYVSDFALWNGTSVSLTGGAVDVTTGSWKATRLSGSTYSFLDFANTSDLGNDVSGNNNDWTPVSLSSADVVSDTPTNNYATLNPLRTNSIVVMSSGNLSATVTSGTQYGAISTFPMPITGKWKCEDTFTGASNLRVFALVAASAQGSYSAAYNNAGNYSWVTGDICYGGIAITAVTAPTNNDVVEWRVNEGVVSLYKNNTLVYTFSQVMTEPMFPAAWPRNGEVHTFNFGQRPFAFTPPDGFKALCTANLAATTGQTSGSFTGSANADGPCVFTGAVPETLSINGNAVIWGTHADRLATGFKIRTASSAYNASGANSWVATYDKKPTVGPKGRAPATAQGNP